MSRKKDIEDYLSEIEIRGPWSCWRSAKKPTDNGYVVIRVEGRWSGLHRAVYRHLIGDIQQGLDLDHLCRNRWCCNPNHVEQVTRLINVQRGNTGRHNRVKTACPQGHPYSRENTTVRKSGFRLCRTCNRIRTALWRSHQ